MDPALTRQRRRGRWVFAAFAASALAFVALEHRVHVLGILPYVILLACPLMHFFMHGGHGEHGSRERGTEHGSSHDHGDARP